MPEDFKAPPVPEESVIRVLEQQSRHGMDQETMLIYINSINLMNLLSLIQRRYQGNTNAYLPLPIPSNTGAQPDIAGTGAGTGPSMENMLGMLMNMLGQGGGGMNPAALMSLLGPLLGQNADLAGMMKMLGNMFGKTGAG
ncbi:MAG: hypothetical protein K6U74_16205, partial [Firmicutes bacterium]|nr:hypothetical protein [Bacillota bacterium]